MTITVDGEGRPPSTASWGPRQQEKARQLAVAHESSWFDRAECRGMDPKLFFPESGRISVTAKRACARCPVSVECRAYAREHASHGVWAGENLNGILRSDAAQEAAYARAMIADDPPERKRGPFPDLPYVPDEALDVVPSPIMARCGYCGEWTLPHERLVCGACLRPTGQGPASGEATGTTV